MVGAAAHGKLVAAIACTMPAAHRQHTLGWQHRHKALTALTPDSTHTLSHQLINAW